MLVPDFGPTMKVIAYWPFQDGESAEAVGGSGSATAASDAAHEPTRLLRTLGVIGFSSESVPHILLCRASPNKAPGCAERGQCASTGRSSRKAGVGARPTTNTFGRAAQRPVGARPGECVDASWVR